jgi:hypothetical protein
MTPRIVSRRCPDCGAVLDGRPGLEWMVCPACPLAVDPFREPPRRVRTFRPAGDRTAEAGPRLPFWLFRLGPRESPLVAWVNAFRVAGLHLLGDAGASLTDVQDAPELEPGPLGASIARGPGQALRLLRARLGIPPGAAIEVLAADLVSLGCAAHGGLLCEPRTRIVYPSAAILPARR